MNYQEDEEETATQLDPEDLMDNQETTADYEGETDVEDVDTDDEEIPMGSPLTRQNAMQNGGKRRTKRRRAKKYTKKRSTRKYKKRQTKGNKKRHNKKRSRRRH